MKNSNNLKKVLILGSTGFLGRNLNNYLQNKKIKNINIVSHSGKNDVDATNSIFFDKYLEEIKPDIVINCLAYVGGISFGYKYPAELLNSNLQMTINLYKSSQKNNVNMIINPISNCAYPGNIDFYEEKNFWNGKPHDSVFEYAMTRRIIVAMGEAYYKQYGLNSTSVVFSNMYGEYDHFDIDRSHALGALIYKIHKAKLHEEDTVEIWGTGEPVREWLYVQDAAVALSKSIELEEGSHFFNVGVDDGISIKNLAEKISDIIGWDGKFIYNTSKPNGVIRKTVEGSLSKKYLNWKPETSLDEGLKKTIEWYLESYEKSL